MATMTAVVTKRGAMKPIRLSAAHRSANNRPREPLHQSTWAQIADSSIGVVSAASAIAAVDHGRVLTRLAMLTTA